MPGTFTAQERALTLDELDNAIAQLANLRARVASGANFDVILLYLLFGAMESTTKAILAAAVRGTSA